MEENRKKRKEYYQANFPIEKVFRISFFWGLILIGIFLFGFYIGSKKEKIGIEKKERTVPGKLELLEKEMIKSDKIIEEMFLDFFDDNLGEEIHDMDIEIIEK